MRKSVASGRQRQVEWSERRANRLGRALACGLLLCWSACASGWKIEDPDRLLPELSREQSRMLRDVNPYVLAFDDLLTPFLCRWRSPATLSVALDPGASEEDRRVLELADIDVEDGASDFVGLKGVQQGCLVDDLAPRHVEDHGSPGNLGVSCQTVRALPEPCSVSTEPGSALPPCLRSAAFAAARALRHMPPSS